MASTSSPIGHNLTSNSNHIKPIKTPHLTLLSHKYSTYAGLLVDDSIDSIIDSESDGVDDELDQVDSLSDVDEEDE